MQNSSPHLKCIAPFELNFDDFYERGFYTGGVHHLVWYCLTSGTHPCRVGLACKNVVPAMEKELSPEELRERVEEACKNPDLLQYPYLYQVLRYPYKNPFIFDQLLNPLDGEYYQKRSYGNYLDRVVIPTFVGGPFHGPFGVSNLGVQQADQHPLQEDAPLQGHGPPGPGSPTGRSCWSGTTTGSRT